MASYFYMVLDYLKNVFDCRKFIETFARKCSNNYINLEKVVSESQKKVKTPHENCETCYIYMLFLIQNCSSQKYEFKHQHFRALFQNLYSDFLDCVAICACDSYCDNHFLKLYRSLVDFKTRTGFVFSHDLWCDTSMFYYKLHEEWKKCSTSDFHQPTIFPAQSRLASLLEFLMENES